MSLRGSQLPQTCSIYGLSDTIGDYGNAGAYTLLYSNINCRVTNNELFGNDSFGEQGYLGKSTHIIFMNQVNGLTTISLEIGYKIVVNGINYIINYIDSAPGGVETHHYQIYCSAIVKG